MILHEIESANRKELEAVQLSGLKKTVEAVFHHVPFYREKLKHLNLKPEQITEIADIEKLPFTTKKDLRDQYPFGLFAVDQRKVVRIHCSSGTSGKPTVVGYTKNDIDHWADIVARSIAIAGGEPGDTLHNAYGYGLFTGGLGLHFGSERLGIATVPVSTGNTSRQITLIEDFRPQIISGTPSYVLNIAEKMEKMGKNPRETSLKYGIFGAETWSEEMRRTLEDKFAIKACDIYGLSEVMGPGIAMECHEAQDGLHIQEDHFYAEVIDPDTLDILPDGEEGELVLTSLTKEALPMIRYRTGDIVSLRREKCKCGRNTLRMSRVKGRIDDMLIIRGVNVFPSEIELHLLSFKEITPQYQLYLKKKGTLDEAELHIEVSNPFFQDIEGNLEHEAAQLLKNKIEQKMKETCFIHTHVKLAKPFTLPRPEGKVKRVIDMRKKATV